jgi:hypothetical protein
VGGRTIVECWIPAEDLPALNADIVGAIEVVSELAPAARRHERKGAKLRGLAGLRWLRLADLVVRARVRLSPQGVQECQEADPAWPPVHPSAARQKS